MAKTTQPEKVPTLPTQPNPVEHMPEQNLREIIEPELDQLFAEGLLSDEDKTKIREAIVEKLNKAVNIPLIGEAIGAALFRVALKIAEKIGGRFAKGLATSTAECRTAPLPS